MISTPVRPLVRAAALAAALAVGFVAAPGAAVAAAPQVKTQAPGYYRMMLGDFEVTALSDGTVDLPMDKLLKQPAARTTSELKKGFLGVPTETSVNGFLINTGSKLVLIDTGAGGLFGPTLGKLAASLQAAGYQPGQVDDIFITHMHPDHVGGLAAGGQAAFPNAVVHIDKRDTDFWLSADTLAKAPEGEKGMVQGAQASLAPYVAAGKLQPFEGASELVPGVRSLPSHGHTPGHASYVIESKGQKLVVIGDLIHVGAVQLDDPAVTIDFDSDRKAAAAQRAAVFAQAAKEGDWVAAAHLSFPGLGHLRAVGRSWQWIAANYTIELK